MEDFMGVTDGCAELADRDNDGVTDVNDGCPDKPGPASNNGCPEQSDVDTDGDGVYDFEAKATNPCLLTLP